MQFKAIKNLAATIAVLVSATAGLSAMDMTTSLLDDSRCAKPQPRSCGWSLHFDHNGGCAEINGVKAKISACGKILDAYGTSNCIGVKEKRSLVQAVETLRILMAVNCQYSNCYIVELIKGFEHCPCPEIKEEPQHCLPVVVKPDCHDSRPQTPVCHKKK